ncbi:MAG TPA: nucleotidyltransferase domain-containing protein [Candidatus Anoxymicrobiaceae bacterium]|jgi:uncharacterized protein
MKTKAKIDISEKELRDFARRWNILELALFGSVLRDDFNEGSDVDIVATFAPDSHYSLFDLVRMEDELKELLGRDVDLIDRRSVDRSRNYLRKRDVLSSLESIYVAG